MNAVNVICDTILKIVSMILSVPIIIFLFIIVAFAALLGLAVIITVYIVTLFITAHENYVQRR